MAEADRAYPTLSQRATWHIRADEDLRFILHLKLLPYPKSNQQLRQGFASHIGSEEICPLADLLQHRQRMDLDLGG